MSLAGSNALMVPSSHLHAWQMGTVLVAAPNALQRPLHAAAVENHGGWQETQDRPPFVCTVVLDEQADVLLSLYVVCAVGAQLERLGIGTWLAERASNVYAERQRCKPSWMEATWGQQLEQKCPYPPTPSGSPGVWYVLLCSAPSCCPPPGPPKPWIRGGGFPSPPPPERWKGYVTIRKGASESF